MASSKKEKKIIEDKKKEQKIKEKKEVKNKEEKLNLSNGNSKQHKDKSLNTLCSSDLEKQDNNTTVINGPTSGTKPKRKREEHEHDEEDVSKTHAFPINRIRTVIKGEDPNSRVSHEAIIAINKATEKFLEQLTLDAYTRCVQERKKSLSYMHLAHVVSKERRYDFLSDFVPGKVKAEDALKERYSGGSGGG
ncbi:hypothetical protein Lal_00019604 [Lupinus albus]|uniref:Putative transcription factor Hap3/NF-YB family n=1 Tax=Lupinus albus TaxID=3870 RepID=A0A6A4R382_LUPAL|nr:putative transcription factor Hap3/NF-YB family [Lupinus albus]KAF1899476.1 hypothetical protein Lal_00019604 [Lupinus albus]